MKKILIVFLVIDILLLLCYCAIQKKDDSPVETDGAATSQAAVSSTAVQAATTPQVTQGKDTTAVTTPEEPKKDYFASYESILELCRMAVESLDYVNQNPNGLADQLFGFEDSTEKEWFLALDSSLTVFYPGRGKEDRNSPHYKLSLGYDYKDLNGDGIDELVLLTDEFIVIAIFSMAEGKPVLLANYRERHRAWIDENGWIHHNGSSGAAYSDNIVYKVAAGGASLEVIAGFGTNGYEWVGEEDVTIYYKLVNGEKVRITKDEHDSLEKYFGEYLGWDATKQVTKEKAGLVFQPLFVDAAMAAFERMLDLKIPVYDTRQDKYVFLDKCVEDVDYFYYAVIDLDGDSVNEFVIQGADTLIFHYYQGVVYLYNFSIRQMDNLFTDGTAQGHHQGAEYFESSGYRIVFEGKKLKQQVLWEEYYDLTTKERRFTIEGKEVSQEEYDRYFEGKVSVPFSLMLNRSETCLNYDAKELWKEDLVKLLSSLEPYDPENPGLNSYAVGLFDLNFDNIPEVLVAYPGGSMGNIWVHIYDLKHPEEPIAYYDGAGFGGDGKTLHLTVAKTGEDYVVLAEGEIRDPEAGWCHMIAKLSSQLPTDKRCLQSEAWFVIADQVNTAGNGPYYYMGESVEKAKYDEEYQKFQKEYTVFQSTQIKLVYWTDYDLTDREQLVLDMAEALLHSKQQFIDYNK